MSETRWMSQKEWDNEREQGFDIELKDTKQVSHLEGYICHALRCDEAAEKIYIIGPTDKRGGMEIPLCFEHDDEENAFNIYKRSI